jgi:hypothetical protein
VKKDDVGIGEFCGSSAFRGRVIDEILNIFKSFFELLGIFDGESSIELNIFVFLFLFTVGQTFAYPRELFLTFKYENDWPYEPGVAYIFRTMEDKYEYTTFDYCLSDVIFDVAVQGSATAEFIPMVFASPCIDGSEESEDSLVQFKTTNLDEAEKFICEHMDAGGVVFFHYREPINKLISLFSYMRDNKLLYHIIFTETTLVSSKDKMLAHLERRFVDNYDSVKITTRKIKETHFQGGPDKIISTYYWLVQAIFNHSELIMNVKVPLHNYSRLAVYVGRFHDLYFDLGFEVSLEEIRELQTYFPKKYSFGFENAYRTIKYAT